MSDQKKLGFKPILKDDQESIPPFVPIFLFTSKRFQRKKQLTKNQAVKPAQENNDGAAMLCLEGKGFDLGAGEQQVTKLKPEYKHGGDPDVKGKNLSHLEPIKMPGAGDSTLQM